MIALEAARWPGGPQICPAANLPAFREWQDAQAFLDRTTSTAVLQWRCQQCGCWHFWTKPHAPAGESCGTARAFKIPREIVEQARGATS